MSDLTEHVIDDRGYALIGDSRGIIVPWTKRQEVWEWAGKNKIIVEYQGSMSGLDLWYVRNDVHRAWFALKWK